ncbi:flavone synthase [Phtheirospermum japonicum]|uniref:Flavone synthase n=1 Tax=Phtheirospermum japonicum TaxID=374723 RepID=A0A830B6Q0_9LAMI|nr:flavone synthase [Phtheirospermum japonicum]
MKIVCSSSREFFNLGDGEKKQYEVKSASDPIKCGNFNFSTTLNKTFTLWRDYLKLYVHPEFHCPSKPQVLRNVLLVYTEKTWKLAKELVKAVSETLELEKSYLDQALKLNSSFQMFAANFYPPYPEPDQAIDIPPRTDVLTVTAGQQFYYGTVLYCVKVSHL